MTTQNINKEQFEKVIQGRRPVLVEFWAPWCVYCRRLGPAYDQIGQQRGSELAVVKINIDEEPDIASREGVDVVPTLVLYQEGQSLGTLVAPESKAAIDVFLQEHLGQ